MTLEEFVSLETGDSVRIDYDGIVADYIVERTPNEVCLVPAIAAIRIPADCSAAKWNLGAMSKRKSKQRATKPSKKTKMTQE